MQSDIVDTLYPVYTLYSYGLENVEKLESKLDLDVNRVRIGSTIGVHIGPNAFGKSNILNLQKIRKKIRK